MLVQNHYEILEHEGERYVVRLREDCPVYEGHFPGEPISPGVCNIQLLLELAGAKRLNRIKVCRMTRIIRPGETLEVEVHTEDGKLVGRIGDALTLEAEIG